jgi:hypothetical protein
MVYREAITLQSGTVRVALGKIKEGAYFVKAALENGNTVTRKVLVN